MFENSTTNGLEFEVLICYCLITHSSFPIIHKVGNVDIIVLLNFENNSNTVINHVNFNSKCHDKNELVLNLIQLVTISNIFP